jgi:hypothetical protein
VLPAGETKIGSDGEPLSCRRARRYSQARDNGENDPWLSADTGRRLVAGKSVRGKRATGATPGSCGKEESRHLRGRISELESGQ